MSYEITLPNGEVVEVDDAVAPEKATEIIKKRRKELFQTELLSPQGIKGLFSTMGENIDASILGAKKGLHQEVLDAMQADLKRYTPGTPEHQQQLQKVQEQQQIAHEYAAGAGHLRQTIEQEVPNPSIPMEAAMGVAPSMVNMAPSLLTRNPMPLAQQGLEQFRGQAYGAARDQGATPGAASMYGNISGPMEAITEWMPMGKMFDSLGREATSMIIAKTLGREIASEEVNTIVDKVAEQAIVTPDKPIAQFLAEMGHDIAVTGLQAGMQTVAMAPLIHSANTPGITDSTSRDLPPIEEAPPSNKTPGLPAAPPPGPAFTDSSIGYEQSRAELAALEAEVDAGLELGEPVPAVAAAPTNPEISSQMQMLNNRVLADFGMTPEVRNNPHNFDDPNTSVEPSERRVVRTLGISGITNQKWGGTDLSKIDLSNGPVVLQVGEDNHVRPAHYMKGLIDDIYQLAQEFNPQGVYVILPQDAGVRGDAKAERGAHFYQDGVHYIIPKHLTNQTKSGSHKSKPGAGNYSPYANLDAYSTMGHEFGHSLIQDFFFQGLAPQERTLLELALEQGQALPELTTKLNPAAQAILTSWQELREGVKSGKVSRTEAAVRLLSPAKLQNKTLMKRMRGLVEYQLEFNEYLAEQVAKAMFTQERMGQSKTLENTFTYNRFEPGTILGNMEGAIQSWLGPLLETMQKLFGRLSAMEMAGPAASSAEWLKQLQLNAHELVQQRMEGAKAGPVKVAEAPVVEPQNPKQLASTLKSLREAGLVKTNSKQHRELARMLRDGNYEGFLTAIEPILGKKLANPKSSPTRFDLTDQVGDMLDHPGIRRRIAQHAVSWGDIINDDNAVVGRRVLAKYGPAVTVARKLTMPNGNSMVDMFVMLESAYQNIPEEDIAGFINGEYTPNVDESSTLQFQYHTATNEFGVFSFPFASDFRLQMEEELGNIKMDKKSRMPQLQGVKVPELLDMMGEFLARVRVARSESGVQTAEYEVPVVYTRTSGANIGKRGRELFGPEILGGKVGNVGYGNPQAVFARGTAGEYGLIAYNPLDVEMLLGQASDMVFGNRVVEAQILNPFVARDVMDVSPEGLARLAEHAKLNDHDSVSITSPLLDGPVVLTLFPGRVQPSSAKPELGSRMRFDDTPEGQEAASRWELLRDKLHLPHLADSISKFWSLQWSTLQMQQLAHMNPQWHWMHNFSANVQKFYRKVGQMHSRADAVVRQLQWLGKENISKLQKFTLAEYKSGVHWTELRRKDDLGHWEHIPTETTYAKLKEFGIDPDSTSGKRFLRLYIEAKNALQYQMDEQQRVMYELQAKKYSATGMEANLRQARLETAALYKQLRAAPYWPQHSFGKYRVQVWNSDAVGKVLLYESATDSETEAKVLEQKARAKYPQGALKSLVLTPDESFLMRLPVEFLDDLQIILGLDSGNPDDMLKLSQIRDSMQSLYSKVPGQTYDPIKRVVEGGSTDFVKVFADFSLRNSNFIAKMEYRKNMQTDIAGAESDPANQEFSANKAEIARAIEFMKATVNYMMNPQEELATLRGIVAIGYLWGNVKTAVLNFWGLAHTWAWLNRELGYGKGTVTFGKSVWNSTRTQGHEWGSFLGSVMEGAAEGSLLSVTDPNWEMVDGKPTELRQALEQAKQENVLDQSYAYYLATQATRGNLIRMASASLPGKTFKGLVDAGMSLFRGTELLIRRSTFIAAYRTMQQTRPDATPKERYEEAVRLVGLLQGDYTKGNRPELMRGQIKSFITIFMTFVQTASWNAYGGLEKGLKRQEAMEGRASPKFYRNYTAQLVLLYLFMAGLEGLPGMENIMDLLDAMFKKANNGKSAREGLREVLDELNMDPMSVMRGATFNLAGLDLSRSIGLGRLVPGTDVLAEEHGTTKEAIGAGVTAVAGVGGGYIQWLIDTIGATSDAVEAGTDLGVTAEKQMARLPGGLGNMFKAAQWAQYDARGPGGGLLAHDEATGMAREIQSWEIVAKSLGFQPASISRAQTLKAGQYEARAFWTARKRVLLDAYWQASEIAKDREAIADARRAIAEYNEAVPTKGLKITSTSIKQSMARRNDAVEAAEQYSTMQKSLQELYQQQAESFALDIAE